MFRDLHQRTPAFYSQHVKPFTAFAILGGAALLFSLTCRPAVAQSYTYSGTGTQVLPTGNYAIVYNQSSGTLIINPGSTIGSLINLDSGTLEIYGSSFTDDSFFDGSIRSWGGVVDIYGGSFSSLVEAGGQMNIWGGQIGRIMNGDGAPLGPTGSVVTSGVNLYGSGFTTPTFLYNASSAPYFPNVYGTWWQIGGNLTTGDSLNGTKFWNVHANTGPTGLREINAPTAPEPGSLALALLGIVAATVGAVRRARERHAGLSSALEARRLVNRSYRS